MRARNVTAAERAVVLSPTRNKATLVGLPQYQTCLGICLLAFGLLFIFRLSFVVDGVRYFTLADDQMISMRFAENLADGRGLVWNPQGPRVEGYTNFAWMLHMAAFHALGVPKHLTSLCIQLTGLACLLLNLVFVRKIALRLSGGSHAVAFAAIALTAFYIPLDNWALQGTEVSVLTLLVTLCTWLALTTRDTDRPPFGLYALLAAGTLVRPDMIVFAAAIPLALWALQPGSWRRHLLWPAAIVAAVVGAQTAFRLWYFHYPFPNTYYLKMEGFPIARRVWQGARWAVVLLLEAAPLVGILIAGRRRIAGMRGAGMLLWICTTQVVYSIFVGGDAWEWWGGSNRFISIAMPLFFVCVALAGVPTAEKSISTRLAISAVALAVVANLMAYVNYRPVQRMLLIERPLQSIDDEMHVRAALALRRDSTPDAVVAVTWAGAIPYFAERTAVDLLGKSDVKIAHEPMRMPAAFSAFVIPGHSKWDYAYSVGTLKPDAIEAPLFPLTYNLDTPDRYLNPDYELRRLGGVLFYVRRDTTSVGGMPAAISTR